MKAQTMKTEHTPGPWTIQHGHSSRVYLINSPQGHAVGEIVYSDTRNPSDAQLIAAAPDLLAAIQNLLTMPDYDGTTPTSKTRKAAKDAARAAIYKAIGA